MLHVLRSQLTLALNMMSAGASKLEKCSEELVDMGSFTLKESENDVEYK